MAQAAFRNEFERLVGFLGSAPGEQIEVLGEPDDRDRNYVWFGSVNASFCWVDGRIERLYVPTKDAFCRAYEGSPDTFTLEGLRPGMTKAQARQVWGLPDSGADQPAAVLWTYKQKLMETSSGDKACLTLSFDTSDDDPDRHLLTYFGAALVTQSVANQRGAASGGQNAGAEIPFFDRDGILVTNRRVVIRDEMIPLHAIASVDAFQIKQSHKGPMVFYGLSILPICAGNWLLVIGLAAIGAVWQFSQIKNARYALAIRTVDGSGKELTGTDGALFAEVAAAINHAVAAD